jgi:hypothetical protein
MKSAVLDVHVLRNDYRYDAQIRVDPLIPFVPQKKPICEESVAVSLPALQESAGKIVSLTTMCKGGVPDSTSTQTIARCDVPFCKSTSDVAYWLRRKLMIAGDGYTPDVAPNSPEVRAIATSLREGKTLESIYSDLMGTAAYRNAVFARSTDARLIFDSIFGAGYLRRADGDQDVIDRTKEIRNDCPGGSLCYDGWVKWAREVLKTRYVVLNIDNPNRRILPFDGNKGADEVSGNQIAYCGKVSECMEDDSKCM